MATQNSRRLQSILRRMPTYNTFSEVARDLCNAGVLAPHYKVDQEVYLVTTISGESSVVKGSVRKIVWNGKEFQYYIKYDHPKYGEIPSQVCDANLRGVILFDTERTAQSAVDKLNSIRTIPT